MDLGVESRAGEVQVAGRRLACMVDCKGRLVGDQRQACCRTGPTRGGWGLA